MTNLQSSTYWLLRTLIILLIAVCVWQGVLLVKQLNQKTIIEKVNIQPKETVSPSDDNARPQFSKIQQLFEYAITIDKPPEQATIIEHAPATVNISFPPIQLLGVVANSNPEKSLAIIFQENEQKLLGVGDFVGETEVTIAKITENNITLRLSGQDKILKIPPRFTTPSLTEQPDIGQTSKNILSRLKSELSTNPNRFTEYVRFNPVFDENNAITAYRISAGKDAEIFSALGLEQNDLITAISSADFYTPLSNSEALLSLWSQMRNIDSFTLHIKRNSQQYEIVVPLR